MHSDIFNKYLKLFHSNTDSLFPLNHGEVRKIHLGLFLYGKTKRNSGRKFCRLIIFYCGIYRMSGRMVPQIKKCNKGQLFKEFF